MTETWHHVPKIFRSEVSSRKFHKVPLFCNIQWVRSNSTETPSRPPRRIIFSGVQPTGVPHLGNYLGAFRPWVRLQNNSPSKHQLNFSVVDLHALTVYQDPKQLSEWRWDTYVALLAVGLDPKRCRIFFQSEVRYHTELMWILGALATTGYLSRMTQWKSKLNLPEDATLQDGNAKSALKLGLFSYPVLQTADILLYKTTHVPVGEDQQQHLEYARKLAGRFNHIYGNVLTIPEAVISPARRIMSLTDPTKKMSKSDPNPNSRILITDDEETIHLKFKTALTDSLEDITYDPETRPGVSNLLDILKHVRDEEMSSNDLAADFRASSLRVLKETVAGAVVENLREVREKYLQLRSRPKNLEMGLRHNQVQATSSATGTIKEVRRALGLRDLGGKSTAKSYSFKPTED